MLQRRRWEEMCSSFLVAKGQLSVHGRWVHWWRSSSSRSALAQNEAIMVIRVLRLLGLAPREACWLYSWQEVHSTKSHPLLCVCLGYIEQFRWQATAAVLLSFKSEVCHTTLLSVCCCCFCCSLRVCKGQTPVIDTATQWVPNGAHWLAGWQWQWQHTDRVVVEATTRCGQIIVPRSLPTKNDWEECSGWMDTMPTGTVNYRAR